MCPVYQGGIQTNKCLCFWPGEHQSEFSSVKHPCYMYNETVYKSNTCHKAGFSISVLQLCTKVARRLKPNTTIIIMAYDINSKLTAPLIKFHQNWKKRWCIFTQANGEEPCLNYYRSEEEAFSSLPIRRVNLKHCFKLETDLMHSKHKNIFAVHMPNRIYYFSAPSQ